MILENLVLKKNLGVDTSLENELGRCPIDLAREKNFDGVVSLLQDEVDATQMLDSPRDLQVLFFFFSFFFCFFFFFFFFFLLG